MIVQEGVANKINAAAPPLLYEISRTSKHKSNNSTAGTMTRQGYEHDSCRFSYRTAAAHLHIRYLVAAFIRRVHDGVRCIVSPQYSICNAEETQA